MASATGPKKFYPVTITTPQRLGNKSLIAAGASQDRQGFRDARYSGRCSLASSEKKRRGAFAYNCASAAFTASKLGRSFGVGVCSEWTIMPAASTTKTARAELSPMPAMPLKSTP